MTMTLAMMVEEILDRSGRSMSVRQLLGALREMFAATPSPRELKRALYTDRLEESLKRHGSTSYRLDSERRIDRLVRELEAA